MTSEQLEAWDDGRMIVNVRFSDILQANGLTTFDSIWNDRSGMVAKNVLRERTTSRLELNGPKGTKAFFLKRHTPAPLKEYIKPLLRLTRPILGARNEWQAILAFETAQIPTMTPVALGESDGCSFLLTEGLVGLQTLADLNQDLCAGERTISLSTRRRIIRNVAGVARQMHDCNLHHQDFYLYHLLVPVDDPGAHVVVIDLGRVRQRRRLEQRWRIKDLGQLAFAARTVPLPDRLRFLIHYLGRPLRSDDRRLIRRIGRKAAAIARHTRRHSL